MRRTKQLALLIVAAMFTVGGCAGGGLAGGDGDGSSPGDENAEPGDGDDDRAGAGGSSHKGGNSSAGGRGGTGGTSSGSGGSSQGGGAGGSSNQAPCPIRVSVLSEGMIGRVVAGEGRTVTVRAQADSPAPAAAEKQWNWNVTRQGQLLVSEIAATDMLTFSVASRGLYTVAVSNPAWRCEARITINAIDPNEHTTELWMRVVPPSRTEATLHAEFVTIHQDEVSGLDVNLQRGTPVAIAPRRASPLGDVALPSFVRITAQRSTFRWEGFTNEDASRDSQVSARLDPSLRYDVLVVPESGFAPVLLANQTVDQLPTQSLKLTPGAIVEGIARGPEKQLLPAVRVLLRAGELPSSVGETNASGAFSLLASPADYGAIIRAPLESNLPDLTLQPNSGLVVAAGGALRLDIEWNALPQATVVVKVVGPAGAVMEGASVELASLGALPAAGVLRINQGEAQALAGKVVRQATVDATGHASWRSVPHGDYELRVVPTGQPHLSRTVQRLQVQAALGEATVDVAARVKLTGVLLPVETSAGGSVSAYSVSRPSQPPFLGKVNPDGRYNVLVDANQEYRLRFVPNNIAFPVVPLTTPVNVGVATIDMPERKLPGGRMLQGIVKNFRGVPVAGCIVQIFCLGDDIDCVPPAPNALITAVPLAEVLTDAAGKYTLPVVKPGAP